MILKEYWLWYEKNHQCSCVYPTRMPVDNLNAVVDGFEPEEAWAAPLSTATRKLKQKIQGKLGIQT